MPVECICGQSDCVMLGKCHCGCGENTVVIQYNNASRGWKSGQYRRFVRGHSSVGNEYTKQERQQNCYESIDGIPCVWISLGKSKWTLIEESDLPLVRGKSWHLGDGYVRRWLPGDKAELLHQVICPVGEGMYPDHKNRNRADNRRSNLHEVTREQNSWNKGIGKNNSSGHTGVSRCGKRWVARIQANHLNLNLGSYELFEEAVAARVAAEKKLRGGVA